MMSQENERSSESGRRGEANWRPGTSSPIDPGDRNRFVQSQTEQRQSVNHVTSTHNGIWGWLTSPHHRTLLHPTTGLWILGLDWLLFSENALSLGLQTPLIVLIGFFLGGVGAAVLQRRYGRNSPGASMAKGIVGGLVVGLPMPIAGTFVGTIILALSGLAGLKGNLPFKRR